MSVKIVIFARFDRLRCGSSEFGPASLRFFVRPADAIRQTAEFAGRCRTCETTVENEIVFYKIQKF
ncbi:hypothetical protein, partial [Alistipes putredinis]|uniref:hypothetical protein n=1 Tax=Alistipes putredinis TaxID=28117 RepID=UPI003AAC7347